MTKIVIDARRAIEMVRMSHILVLDTETTGLTHSDVPVGYVFTDHDFSVYIPIRHEAGGNIPDVPEFLRVLILAFKERERKGLRTVGHNLSFDLSMAAKDGVLLGAPLEDTLINEGLIDDIAKGMGLDDCCSRHGVTPKKGDELYAAIATRFGGLPDRSSMQFFWRMPGDDPVVVDYAAGDGISTLQLWASQQPRLDEEVDGKSLRRVHQLECDLIPYLARMRRKGLKIDHDYAARVGDEIAEAKKVAEKSLPPGMNVMSPKEVADLFDRAGIDNFPKTPLGAPSFREAWLQTNDLGRAILRVRRFRKLEDSFITPLTDTHNHFGRVHPTLNQSKSDDYGAIGGRLSCSDPNLQAFPKRNYEIGMLARKLVIPDEDMILEEADFKQQEPRLFTHYSEDETLLAGYLGDPPLDIHTMTLNALRGELVPDRDTAKRLGMGMLTGLQAKGLAERMGVDPRTGGDMWEAWMGSFPGIGAFQRGAKAVMLSRGYVRTIMGRIAHLESSKYAYRAVSRIIQGSGADHMKLALLRANQYAEANKGIDILLSIHDSNLWQRAPGTDISELVRAIENTANEIGVIVPIPVDVGSGQNWAEASYGK